MPAALLVGLANAVSLVLLDGRVLSAIVHAFIVPLHELAPMVSAVGRHGVHAVLHAFVPTASGHAAPMMPLFVPLQVTVPARRIGVGPSEVVSPMNTAPTASLALSTVSYGQWVRLVARAWALLAGPGVIAIGVAAAIGRR